MNIGILTFHSTNNYGAVLQAYALQSFLEERGHNAQIIDYRPSYFEAPSLKWSVSPKHIAFHFIDLFIGYQFEQFRLQLLKRTTQVYRSLNELQADIMPYDLCVVGSDQVWNPTVDRRREIDEAYFINFPIRNGAGKISYAASFGTEAIDEQYVPAIRRGLSFIDAISVREASGVDIVMSICGRSAEWVLDPVFLLSKKGVADVIARGKRVEGRNLFLYMYPSSDLFAQTINIVARKQKASIICFGFNKKICFFSRVICQYQSPQSWLRTLNDAVCVVTQSFHGVALSIILKKQFVYLLPEGASVARANRVTSLLSRLGLQDRLLPESASAREIDVLLNEPVDWVAVQPLLDSAREQSVAFLSRNGI